MTQHVTERLSEYLDGDLSGADLEAVRVHVAECAECAGVLEELRAVVAEAVRLESVPAPADLWPGVAARLGPRRRGILALGDRLRSLPGRLELTLPQLAAAGLLLMFLSGGSVWLAMRKPSAVVPGGPVASAPPTVLTPPASTNPAEPRVLVPADPSQDVAVAAFDGGRYDAAVADLERVLRDHGSQLDTTTVRILQQNLATIDRAIEQARRALLADPANPYLNGHLAEQMKLKVRLLQRATEVVSAHG